MKATLKELLAKAHGHDQEAMAHLLDQFKPLLEKYARYLSYDDADSDLTIFFIEMVYELNLSKLSGYGEGQIVSFVQRSVKNKATDLYRKERAHLREGRLPEDFELEDSYPYHATIYFNDMLHHLTAGQQRILRCKFQFLLSDSEIGELLHISRQAVHRTLLRALNQLRREFKK